MRILVTDIKNILAADSGIIAEGALEFLKAAHEDFFITVLTNMPLKDAQEDIKRLDLSMYIDFVLSAADYEMPKPDHRIINVLLALLNSEGKKFEKRDVVLVGDRPSADIRLGNEADVQTIRLIRGAYAEEKPEYPEERAKIDVRDFKELMAVLRLRPEKEKRQAAKQAAVSASFSASKAKSKGRGR